LVQRHPILRNLLLLETRAAPAQQRGREESDQGRPDSRRLEGYRRNCARKIATLGPSRARTASLPTVDLAIPVFGYQNHISIDCGFGFIRQWSATDAAAYEGRRLREGLLDKTNTASGSVYDPSKTD
jgi:IS5 family transposase